MHINPLSKIPTLELEDGQVLFDSHVICRWADRHGVTGPVLFPEELASERDEALGTGLLDVAVPWLVESRLQAPELRSDTVAAAYRLKVNRALDWIEDRIGQMSDRPFDIGHVSIGVALCYLDFRFAAEGWRINRPRLADWHAEFSERPSVRATEFQDEPRPA